MIKSALTGRFELSKSTIWSSGPRNFGSEEDFILDGEAFHHMCCVMSDFYQIKTVDAFGASFGSDSAIKRSKFGEIDHILQDVIGGKECGVCLFLTDLLYSEDTGLILLSMNALHS